MKSRDKKDASPEATRRGKATPFFARYLEGQDAEADAEAKVGGGKDQSNFTFKEKARSTKKSGAKKSGAKASAASAGRKSAASAAKAPPMMTLKYPSDRDEWTFYPYYRLEDVGGKVTNKPVTLKYPSDNDEGAPYYAVYADASDAPKSETAKARTKPIETTVRLSRKKPKG
ncbi:MAG: microviridin/marinostatin family tricyclic proteinase inhibitor [Acidobacteria bacterium]|nr:microviridin/marinostatin family tricyclic proteinase inhibitor [Acidobacteriota bacterium]